MLHRQVVLQDLVLISLVIDCTHEILEAADVNLVVKDALQVFKVDFLGKDCIKLRLVSLAM